MQITFSNISNTQMHLLRRTHTSILYTHLDIIVVPPEVARFGDGGIVGL